MTIFYILLALLCGAALGACAAYFYGKPRRDMLAQENARLLKETQDSAALREQNAALGAANARLQEQAASLEKERVLVEKNFNELAATYRAQFADLASKI